MYKHIFLEYRELQYKSNRWINTAVLSAPALRIANSQKRVEG